MKLFEELMRFLRSEELERFELKAVYCLWGQALGVLDHLRCLFAEEPSAISLNTISTTPKHDHFALFLVH